MPRFLAREELHRCLVHQGHELDAPSRNSNCAVQPPPDVTVTVACELDAIYPPYRQRYFICVKDETDDPILARHPDFTLPELLARIELKGLSTRTVMAGPFRWALMRLLRFPELLLWPRLVWWPDFDNAGNPSTIRHRFTELAVPPSQVGALVLNLAEPSDCRLLWDALSVVAEDCADYYLSDVGGSEVYLLHHHDKVVVSVPNQKVREEMLADFTKLSEAIQNRSGYDIPIVDEDEEGKEQTLM